MTSVFHGSVGQVVPYNAVYDLPKQAYNSYRSTVKHNPRSGGPWTAGKIVTFDFPGDMYFNGMNSYISIQFRNKSASWLVGLLEADTSSPSSLTLKQTDGQNPGNVQDMNNNKAVVSLTDHQLAGHYMVVVQQTFDEQNPRGSYESLMSKVFRIKDNDTNGVITVNNGDELLYPREVDSTFFYFVYILGPYTLKPGGIDNLIRNERVTYGGKEIDYCRNAFIVNRLQKLMGATDQWRSCAGSILNGDNAAFLDEPGVFNEAAEVAGKNLSGNLIKSKFVQDLLQGNSTYVYSLRMTNQLLTNKKILPMKFLDGNWQVEFTLNDNHNVLWAPTHFASDDTFNQFPEYEVDNIMWVAENIEYGESYDSQFQQDLVRGIPFHFCSWHYHSSVITGNQIYFRIADRARSIKSIFVVMRDQQESYRKDNAAFYYNGGQTYTQAGELQVSGQCQILDFQWKFGNRYYPAQQVNCKNGASEAYAELQKAINAFGDYTFSNSISLYDWTDLYDNTRGQGFIISGEFGVSDYEPDTIAGLNAEDLNDIQLIAHYKNPPTDKKLEAYVLYDNLMIVKSDGVVETAE